MKKNEKLSVRRLFRSFGYAIRGVREAVSSEQNAKIHLLALICVIIGGIFFNISRTEWIAVVMASGAVFTAEIFNTAIEALSDAVCSEYDERIGRVKDFAAGAVLITAISALLVGFLIFVPRIYSMFLI